MRRTVGRARRCASPRTPIVRAALPRPLLTPSCAKAVETGSSGRSLLERVHEAAERAPACARRAVSALRPGRRPGMRLRRMPAAGTPAAPSRRRARRPASSRRATPTRRGASCGKRRSTSSASASSTQAPASAAGAARRGADRARSTATRRRRRAALRRRRALAVGRGARRAATGRRTAAAPRPRESPTPQSAPAPRRAGRARGRRPMPPWRAAAPATMRRRTTAATISPIGVAITKPTLRPSIRAPGVASACRPRNPALTRKASETRKARASPRLRAASLAASPRRTLTSAVRRISQKCAGRCSQ